MVEKSDVCSIHYTMSHFKTIATMHTPVQRKAVKDLLLSQVTTESLKDRVQLFEEREFNAGDNKQIDPAVLEIRKCKLEGGLIKESK